MNPAIVAPDGFDIIDMTAGGQINSDQRRNLGSVAKVLQHAASNKLFEGENEHLSSMNNYLSETYQEFRWEVSLPLEKLAGWWARGICVLCPELGLGAGTSGGCMHFSYCLLLWGKRRESEQAGLLLSGVPRPPTTPSAPVTLSHPHVYDFCYWQEEIFNLLGTL